MRWTGRMVALAVAVAAVAGEATVNAAPAFAGAYGDIINDLPSQYPVKIARFGVSGNHYCNTANAGSLTCEEFWLPSGMTDTERMGYWFDTDGFQVEGVSHYYVSGYGWVPQDEWWKIESWQEARCYMSNGAPRCDVYVF